MTLAAMMTGGIRFANQHNLIAGNLTVPAGVTSLTVFASARGGAAGFATVSGNYGGGGGGGGAAVVGCAFSVTPGDTVNATFSTDFWEVQLNFSTTICRVFRGQDGTGMPDFRGAAGGSAYWDLTSASALGGGQQTSAGVGGLAGAITTVAGGVIIGGGGGGAGNTISPSQSGGSGGQSGNGVAGATAVGNWGGGGAGWGSLGGSRLTGGTESSASTEIVSVRW